MIKKNMPDEIKSLYDNLESEALWLHARWEIYRQLFAGSSEDISLLNNTAGFFFWNIERVLRHNVYLSVSRLLDQEGKGERRNLSFQRMAKIIKEFGYHDLSITLDRILEELKESSKGIKRIRDKRISHNDLLAISGVESLPGVSRRDIETVLEIIRKFLNSISGHFLNTEVHYKGTGSVSDGETLLFHLEKSLAMIEIDREGERKHIHMFRNGNSILSPIELVPLYYGWGCPKCFSWNQVLAVMDEVVCGSCNSQFHVGKSLSEGLS